MGNTPLYRYGVKLFHQLLAAANHLDVKLRNGFQLRGGRRHKHAAALSPECLHECPIVKFANDARVNLVACQPALQLLAHGGLGAGDQHGGVVQTGRKRTQQLRL